MCTPCHMCLHSVAERLSPPFIPLFIQLLMKATTRIGEMSVGQRLDWAWEKKEGFYKTGGVWRADSQKKKHTHTTTTTTTTHTRARTLPRDDRDVVTWQDSRLTFSSSFHRSSELNRFKLFQCLTAGKNQEISRSILTIRSIIGVARCFSSREKGD